MGHADFVIALLMPRIMSGGVFLTRGVPALPLVCVPCGMSRLQHTSKPVPSCSLLFCAEASRHWARLPKNRRERACCHVCAARPPGAQASWGQQLRKKREQLYRGSVLRLCLCCVFEKEMVVAHTHTPFQFFTPKPFPCRAGLGYWSSGEG